MKQWPYHIPEARQQAIEEEIQQMLKLGVIEPSCSPWSSPIVLVPKPDGTLRFCNDFRRLNEVSEFDGYPMPRVDELLDHLGRARYISTLDLTKGYWYPSRTVPNRRQLFQPQVATGNTGPFPSASWTSSFTHISSTQQRTSTMSLFSPCRCLMFPPGPGQRLGGGGGG